MKIIAKNPPYSKALHTGVKSGDTRSSDRSRITAILISERPLSPSSSFTVRETMPPAGFVNADVSPVPLLRVATAGRADAVTGSPAAFESVRNDDAVSGCLRPTASMWTTWRERAPLAWMRGMWPKVFCKFRTIGVRVE